MEPDFSGYVTKAGLKCSDGRTITAEAFKHQDQMRVPLVWQHGHDSAENVLGHVDLEARTDGVYGYAYFNDTRQGENGRKIVAHGDITKMSIYAGDLVEKAKVVLHGAIREVSLVLAGANPGAVIDYVRIAHSDGDIETSEDEAIIRTGLDIEFESPAASDEVVEDTVSHAAGDNTDGPTYQEIYDSMSQAQKDVCNYMIGAALADAGGTVIGHAASGTASDGTSIKELYDSMSQAQKEAVSFIVGAALEDAKATLGHSDLGDDAAPQAVYDAMSDRAKAVVHSMIEAAKTTAKTEAIAEHSALINQEGTSMNVFEQQGQAAATLRHSAMVEARAKLDSDAIRKIVSDGERFGSLKESFIAHAGDYGIDNIDVLFPDATLDQNGISIISRRMEWVQDVLSSTRHSPFSRIKSLAADLTADEARARGYVKGNAKKDEIIRMLRRVTTPKTIYKKQKLDRDDIVDITDLDIVAWLKAEMRVMLDEELARAILVSDGRDADDPDKIDEEHIRPVAYDIDMYNTRIELDADFDGAAFIDSVVTAMRWYKGTGRPTLYTTTAFVTPLILAKDSLGRRLYNTMEDLASALRVAKVVEVEAMEQDSDLVAVVVNLTDYTIGADAGGAVAMFDNFDIDYNQQRYLIETRVSGALTKPKSALTFVRNSGRTVTPSAPTFVASTGVVTIPAQPGVVYQNADTNTTLSPGAQTAVAPGATIDIVATPQAGYGFTHDTETEFTFTRDAGV